MTDKTRSFSEKIQEIERRKLRSRSRTKRSTWLGLSVMGVIGWSIVLPALVCTAIGIWLDRVLPQGFSWTLTMMVGGIMLGCLLAYRWVEEENKEINKEASRKDE